MLYATAGILYGVLSITLDPSGRKQLASFLVVAIVAISIAHSILGHIKTFRACFGLMVLSIFGQLVFLVLKKVEDSKMKRDCAYLIFFGAGKCITLSVLLFLLNILSDFFEWLWTLER